jgi:diacylglycerol kinase family enzyme
MSQAVIIVNLRSGAGRSSGHELSRRLAERLLRRGIQARSIAFDTPGTGPGGWRTRLDDALAAGANRVYILGGDGTVLAVTGAVLGRDVALGVVPLGTANLLARDLDIPLDPERAIDVLADAQVRRIDVGRVNGQPFLCASMLGLTTTLARAREAARGQGPLRLWPRLVRKAVLLLRRYPYRRVTLELNGRTLSLRSRAMVIANNPYLPEPGLYPRRGRLNGGLLGIYGVREGPAWELPRVVLRLLNGNWPDEPRIFCYRTPHLIVQAPPSRGRGRRITVLNDGERMRLTPPLQYEVLPCALAVLAPAPAPRRPAPARNDVETQNDEPEPA